MNSIFDHLVFVVLLIIATTLVTRLMLKVGIMALPNHRSSHDKPTPSGGGVGAVAVITVAISLYCLWGGDDGTNSLAIFWLLGGSLIVAVAGFVDDIGKLPNFKTKLFLQISAVMVLFAGDLVINQITLPFIGTINLGWWGYPITLIWVVGLTNAFNFMDGLDGMAGCTAIVSAFFYSIIAFQEGAIHIFVISYIIVASVTGFMPFNFPKARLFMGDVGSQFLGFLFAGLSVFTLAANGPKVAFWIMPILFLHFIFDTTYTFIRRLGAKENITDAHRSHLYQLLNRMGWSHVQVSSLYALFCVMQGITAIWLISASAWSKGLVLLFFLLFYTMFMFLINRAARDSRLI